MQRFSSSLYSSYRRSFQSFCVSAFEKNNNENVLVVISFRGDKHFQFQNHFFLVLNKVFYRNIVVNQTWRQITKHASVIFFIHDIICIIINYNVDAITLWRNVFILTRIWPTWWSLVYISFSQYFFNQKGTCSSWKSRKIIKYDMV